MLINMHCAAVVNGTVQGLNVDRDDGETGNDYVIDCRRRRSPDCPSVDGRQSENMDVGRQSASPMSSPATYWHDVINNGANKIATSRRRCESCKSDVSVTSLPESLASDSDVIDSPPCKEVISWARTSTGNSFMAGRQPEGEMESSSHINAKSVMTSGLGDWSRDVIVDSVVRPPPPTAVGFSISDILRPDFGTIPRPSGPACQRKERVAADRCCPSYPSSVSLLPSTLRRSLVHPYTAAAAFCAAAVAAAGAGIKVASARGDSGLTQRQELLQRQPPSNVAGVRRMTSSRDVTYHNNNNNNTKLRNRYVYEDCSVDDVRHKTASGRRIRVEQASPSSLRVVTTAKPAISRPEQSVLTSPAASQTSSTTSTNGPAARDDAKHPATGDDGSSTALVPLPWPAWVYCTRYSDRPSSGRQSKSCTSTHTPHANHCMFALHSFYLFSTIYGE